jgi:Cys-tRNA(Pro)/Cys-tRNA(Cys) deacylase
MAKTKKLNSMRFLENHTIAYEICEFDDSIHSAEGVAEFFDIPFQTVYKTLVIMPDDGDSSKKPMLALLSAGRQLDLKRFAKGAGFKKVRMASHPEAEKLTGLKVGGISALALMAKNWQVYLDQAATEFETILISAGQRGINLRVGVEDLIKVLAIHVFEYGMKV